MLCLRDEKKCKMKKFTKYFLLHSIFSSFGKDVSVESFFFAEYIFFLSDALYVIQNPKRRVGQGLMSRQKIELLLEAAQSNKRKQLLDEALTSNNYYKSSR